MILISIGSNLPGPFGRTPLDAARSAVIQLNGWPGVNLRGLSRWYKSAPVPPSRQPLYINAVAHLGVAAGIPEPDAAELLVWLQSIEARAGRIRGERNAARTLDLDIIAMGVHGQTTRTAPDPVLPHPRAHLRAFVLMPLLDVAPEWMHPVFCRSARELLAALPPQGIAPTGPTVTSPLRVER
jgi:2-amino-4-hydroxy-6-hydroxymethyldihydropteridine diphosphokinase